MALTSGMKLCPLRFQSLLAAGGMGEVYRAHDSRSNRTIAIKVRPRRSLRIATGIGWDQARHAGGAQLLRFLFRQCISTA
jgi:hypothetical protein